MGENIGEKTIRLGKLCKKIGKFGGILFSTNLFIFIIIFVLICFEVKNMNHIGILILLIIVLLGIVVGFLLIPCVFIGCHLMCIGKIEVNTNENNEILKDINNKLK